MVHSTTYRQARRTHAQIAAWLAWRPLWYRRGSLFHYVRVGPWIFYWPLEHPSPLSTLERRVIRRGLDRW